MHTIAKKNNACALPILSFPKKPIFILPLLYRFKQFLTYMGKDWRTQKLHYFYIEQENVTKNERGQMALYPLEQNIIALSVNNNF